MPRWLFGYLLFEGLALLAVDMYAEYRDDLLVRCYVFPDADECLPVFSGQYIYSSTSTRPALHAAVRPPLHSDVVDFIFT